MDPNIKDNNGACALHYACMNGNMNIILCMKSYFKENLRYDLKDNKE